MESLGEEWFFIVGKPLHRSRMCNHFIFPGPRRHCHLLLLLPIPKNEIGSQNCDSSAAYSLKGVGKSYPIFVRGFSLRKRTFFISKFPSKLQNSDWPLST